MLKFGGKTKANTIIKPNYLLKQKENIDIFQLKHINQIFDFQSIKTKHITKFSDILNLNEKRKKIIIFLTFV